MKTKMYKVLKIKLSTLISNDYNLKEFTPSKLKMKLIMQQDNSIFRHINKINSDNEKVGKHDYIKDIIFINIDRSVTMEEWQIQKKIEEQRKKYEERLTEFEKNPNDKNKKINEYKEYVDGKTALTKIIKNGFIYNGILYKRFGKSSSMAHNSVIAFVSENIFDKLFDTTTMGIDLQKPMVLSKFEAYRGLLFSSSVVIQNELPYIVLVKDYDKYIPNQQIKYTIEEDSEYLSKYTNQIVKTKKYPIYSGTDSVKISCFDGMGIHSKKMGYKFEDILGFRYPTVQIRSPYMKGLSIEFNFHKYFKEILHKDFIIDAFGKRHDIKDVDCIYTLSMWKGENYFNSWDEYKDKFKEYKHEFCVSKYSRPTQNEKLMTRANFQYLQSLTKLDKNKILDLASYSKEYIEKIINGDLLYSLLFLGLSENSESESQEIDSYYMEAVKINPHMLKDKTIQKSLYNLLKKTINGYKLGRLFVEAHYSMVYGDLKLFIEHIAELEPVGILKAGEFYSPNYDGNYTGFRSPLVHKSEVNKMNFIKNNWLNKWCEHLDNLIMLNGYDISMPRMGGMDLDGDIIWVTKNSIIYNSIEDEDIAVVVDKDDKALASKTIYSIDELIEYESRTLSQRIGEITNISTGFSNQTPNSEKSKKYIDDQNVFLRVAQGHEIDSIKTGTKYVIAPYYKNVKLPYFLIYRYPKEKAFLKKIKKENEEKKNNGEQADRYNVSFTHSPMNELCWNIEKWEIEILSKFSKSSSIDTYKLLMNKNVEHIDEEYWIVKQVYKEFNSDYRAIIKEYKTSHDIDKRIMSLYDDYKSRIYKLDIDKERLVNYCVLVSYIKDKEDLKKDKNRIEKAQVKGKTIKAHDKSSKFAWIVVPEQIINNLKINSPDNTINIVEDKNGEEYLGRKYIFEKAEEVI
ncbi:MAG: hypothetical protein PHT02_00085 [Tissierellia bacterium]|nr:hypothetical protein [Tissierellia bacterium]